MGGMRFLFAEKTKKRLLFADRVEANVHEKFS
jgi:hypothetical protein